MLTLIWVKAKRKVTVPTLKFLPFSFSPPHFLHSELLVSSKEQGFCIFFAISRIKRKETRKGRLLCCRIESWVTEFFTPIYPPFSSHLVGGLVSLAPIQNAGGWPGTDDFRFTLSYSDLPMECATYGTQQPLQFILTGMTALVVSEVGLYLCQKHQKKYMP